MDPRARHEEGNIAAALWPFRGQGHGSSFIPGVTMSQPASRKPMIGKVCIVVIGRNEAKTLGAVFERFKELSTRLGCDCHLVYVDSDSTDSSVAIAEEFRNLNPQCPVRIIRIRGSLSAAIARNAGIRYVDPESKYIFFLDGDVVFDPDFVQEAILTMEQNQRIGSVSGVITNSFGTAGTDLVTRRVARSSHDNTLLWHGGNFVTRKSVVEQVGMFDHNLVRCEDIDYSFRMRNKGYILWMVQERMGIHYTTAYMSPTHVLEGLRMANYVYSGLLFRKYCVSRRCLDMVKSISGVLFRCSIVCCALLSIFFYPLGIAALLGCAIILSRKSAARGETLCARALSLIAGIQFILGLFKVRKNQVCEVQVI